jgi:hypothetical protein
VQFYRCILGAFLALPLFSQTFPSPKVGFYHWDGAYHASISEGVEAIAAVGGHVARLAVSARMDVDYGMGSSCIPDFTLAGAVQEPDMKKALDHPAIDVFILTAYDGVTFGDCVTLRFLNPSFYTPSNEAAIVQEYSDLTLYLYQIYQHTNKQFIISNWESDNQVYCSDALLYSTNYSYRALCDGVYPQLYGNATPADSFRGLRLWFEARQKGIEDGRARASAMGIVDRNRRVYFAPEVNVCRHLRYGGLKSALYDVVPFIKFDYVSYSSYESLGLSDPRNDLLEDLGTIRSVIGSSNIIIGEMMTASPGADPGASIQTLSEVMDAALSWGVAYIIYWSVYGPDDCAACGLYDASGRITPTGEFFEDYFLGLDPPVPRTRPRHLRARGTRP